MTTLIIARHGNTFGPEDTPTRVGARTDIPLVDKGIKQAQAIGRYLKDHNLLPDAVYSATLKRTQQTAEHALKAAALSLPVYTMDIFNEIDYGIDENQTEETVIKRIGKDAITQWDKNAIVPDGWRADPDDIIQGWRGFARQISKTQSPEPNQATDLDETILVVTSNGIARFAPHITDDFDSFAKKHTIKLSTGALGILTFSQGKWRVADWNIVPLLV